MVNQEPSLVLIGNKLDLPHLRKIIPAQHFAFSKINNLTPFVCSAKTGEKVSYLFHKIAADLCGVSLTTNELESLDYVIQVVKQNNITESSIKTDNNVCSLM